MESIRRFQVKLAVCRAVEVYEIIQSEMKGGVRWKKKDCVSKRVENGGVTKREIEDRLMVEIRTLVAGVVKVVNHQKFSCWLKIFEFISE